MQQPPLRNQSQTGVNVFSHSGEYARKFTDVIIQGLSLHFRLVRNYRSSLSGEVGYFGRGCTFNYARRLEKSDKGLFYFDGDGRSFEFTKNPDGSYASPLGMYCELTVDDNQAIQKFRYGTNQIFELPENGGRMLKIIDRNNNSLNFEYTNDKITVTDTLKRAISLSIENGLIVQMEDFSGRSWKYFYDGNQCLVEVRQPGTRDFPDGTSVSYKYGKQQRLVMLLNAKGQAFLTNYYDDKTNRVIAQEHGNGKYKLDYKKILNDEGKEVLVTQTILKNGGVLVQTHNGIGNEIQRILKVSAGSLAPEEKLKQKNGFVEITTLSEYNEHGELVRRNSPGGNSAEWVYDNIAASVKDKGNVLETKSMSSRKGDNVLSTAYGYTKDFQLLLTEKNPKGVITEYEYDNSGNLVKKILPQVTIQPVSKKGNAHATIPVSKQFYETYEYNEQGQLTKKISTDGIESVYCYYPAKDPLGTKQKDICNKENAGGFISSVIKDAKGIKQVTGTRYDIHGNSFISIDPKGNTLERRFNAMGKMEAITCRKQDAGIIDYHFDEDYNIVSEIKEFEHYVFDNKTQKEQLSKARNITNYAYNVLNNLIERKFGSDDKTFTEKYILDSNENIIQIIQPMGNKTEFKYDERNLVVEKILGAGSSRPSSYKYGYTKSGQLKRYTDTAGNSSIYEYDGYQRQTALMNPVGTSEKRFLDDNGNTEKIQVWGYADDEIKEKRILLDERIYALDEWNRVYKADVKCKNAETGKPISKSDWNGIKGNLSSVIEYGNNNLPTAVWNENNNVLFIAYDGLGRRVSLENAEGQKRKFQYDANDNVVSRIESGKEGKNSVKLSSQYDELDRLVSQQKNKENPVSWKYNAQNQVIKTTGSTGIEITHLHDSLGRYNGTNYNAVSADNKPQLIILRQEYNDNFQLTTYTHADGQQTTYEYDSRGRLISKTNGTGETFEYDYDEGNFLKLVRTPDDKKIETTYDATGRMKKRKFTGKGKKEEYFKYDGKNCLLSAETANAKQLWTYDSASRVTKQIVNEKAVGFNYDNAGNITGLSYPGGRLLQYHYDTIGRVTAIEEKNKGVLVSYQYNALGQFDNMLYQNGIKAGFKYDSQQRLASIEFIDTSNNKLLDGCRYEYDDAGRPLYEVHLQQGNDKGDRYFYDNADRVTRVQYGVDKVSDEQSSFEEETRFEYNPEGRWLSKTTLDGKGNIIKTEEAKLDKSGKYISFGNKGFDYDRFGNIKLEARFKDGTALIGLLEFKENKLKGNGEVLTYWTYEYDEHNRISKAEEHDHDGNIMQTIEYFYDATGNLIERKVTVYNDPTSGSGVVTDYTYVYANGMLIQEYVNGELAKEYTFGPVLDLPVQIDKYFNGRRDVMVNTFDGRQNLTSIFDVGKNMLQGFGIDVSGGLHSFEIGGVTFKGNDAMEQFKNTLTDLLGGYGNNTGKGIFGGFRRATSVLTDALSSMQINKGTGRMPGLGVTANPHNYNGKPSSLVAGGFWEGIAKLSDVITLGGAFKGDSQNKDGGSDANTTGFRFNGSVGDVTIKFGSDGFSIEIKDAKTKVEYNSSTNSESAPENKDAGTNNGSKAGGGKSTGIKGGGADSGAKDGGVNSGTSDSGTSDSGTSDSGTSDSGTSDSGTSDSGTSDSGTSDSGTSDSGTSDSGTSDSGTSGLSDPEYSSGGFNGGPFSYSQSKKLEARLWGNITPVNPALADRSFTITAEDIERVMNKHEQIEHTEEDPGGNGSFGSTGQVLLHPIHGGDPVPQGVSLGPDLPVPGGGNIGGPLVNAHRFS